jgi:hypothetical protein
MLHKWLRLHPYKFELRPEIKDTDPPDRVTYANFILNESDK